MLICCLGVSIGCLDVFKGPFSYLHRLQQLQLHLIPRLPLYVKGYYTGNGVIVGGAGGGSEGYTATAGGGGDESLIKVYVNLPRKHVSDIDDNRV